MESTRRPGHRSRAEVSGPLAPYAGGFREDLAAKGYHPQVIGRQVRLMSDLSKWLEARGSSSDGLAADVAAEYAPARRTRPGRLARTAPGRRAAAVPRSRAGVPAARHSSPGRRGNHEARPSTRHVSRYTILSGTRQASHHHVKPAGESAGQPLNRVFERYRYLAPAAKRPISGRRRGSGQ